MLFNCHRSSSDDDTTIPVDQLPATTQTGANTAGCLVNGKVLLPRGQKPQNGPVLAAFYQFIDGGYHFGLGIEDYTNSKTVAIGSHNITLEQGKTYSLAENLNDDSAVNMYANYWDYKTTFYSTSDIVTGEIKITRLDTSKFIISGTFWFDAVNANGEKIEVREGRFDLHYAP